jgi:hypothetical protein
LLIEPPVGRHAADLASGLQLPERDGQRRRQALLRPLRTKMAHGAADRVADAVGLERALPQRGDDGG